MHAGDGAERRLHAPEAARAEAGLLQLGAAALAFAALGLGLEAQRGGVEAIAQAGRARAVLEDMAEMRIAAGADDLVSDHAMAAVGDGLNIFRGHGLEEAGPASPGIELRVGGKERQVAANAVINTILVVVVEEPAEGALRAFAARDAILLLGELLLPFLVGLDDFLHGGGGAVSARVWVGDARGLRQDVRAKRPLGCRANRAVCPGKALAAPRRRRGQQ